MNEVLLQKYGGMRERGERKSKKERREKEKLTELAR